MIPRAFRGLPIRAKLVLIIMATSLATLVLALGALALVSHRRSRQSLVHDVSALARLIADRSTAALVFDDPLLGQDNLTALRGIPSVKGAALLHADGRPAATFRAVDPKRLRPPEPLEDTLARFHGEDLEVHEPVRFEEKVIGTVYIRSGLDELKLRTRDYLLWTGAILALAALAAYLMARSLQRAVSEPISRLTETAERVAVEQDYTTRAAKLSDDELGTLVEAFNGMLAQVQDRDRALQEANERLESLVLSRTAELRAANERLAAVFQAAGVGIVLLREQVILDCNPRLEAIFGYGPGEILGQSTRIWHTDEVDYAEAARSVYASVEQGGSHFGQHRFRRKDGQPFWARLAIRVLDPADPNKGAVGVVEDITAERENQEALRAALEAAEAANRIKSAFLATMSHELRTPLNSIIGFTGILLQGLVGPLNPEQKKQLGMVKDSSYRLLDLINDVLDLSKIEAGQLELGAEPFDLGALIDKTVHSLEPLADKKHLRLAAHHAADLPLPTGDARRVGQVLLNLLSNAVKFTEQGTVEVHAEAVGDRVRVRVTDSGIGIRPEDLEKLFRPFSQLDMGLSRKYEGTGLGLSICKRLVEMMGGEIGVESRPGEGSTFHFTLPAR